ncbi:MAG: DNA-directed RNA polymerase subunit alpha [Candidatus Komeilibacteria bacterium]
MLTITPPDKIKFSVSGDNKAEVIIEPCYPGFGVTIANSLRRVLLSSLDGAAITGFKIAGVDHEFSSVDGIKEDVVDIILNLKKVRLKIFADTDEDIKLILTKDTEGKVTAADITPDSNVEIINKDQLICTLTDKKKLEMEIFVRRGRGYVTVEQRDNEKNEIGTIAIDSLYSPVTNVGFRLENTRVGEMTNYEKIIMSLETDNSITPEEAIKNSAMILLDQFSVLAGQSAVVEEEPVEETEVEEITDKVEEKVEELEAKPAKKRGRPKKNDK